MSGNNAFIINSGGSSQGGSQTSNTHNGTRIVYSNKLASGDFIVGPGETETSVIDEKSLYDYKTTTSITINSVDFTEEPYIYASTRKPSDPYPYSERLFDFVALAGINFKSSGIQYVRIYAHIDNGNGTYSKNQVGFVDTRSFNDDQPFIVFFNETYSYKIDIEFQSGIGDIDISLVYAGNSENYIKFPNGPDSGFQPGQWNNLNQERSVIPDGNSFGKTKMTNNGTEEVYSFTNLNTNFLNSEYRDFVKSFRYLPVFSQWNSFLFPKQVIFGRMSISRARYNDGGRGNVSFKIKGIV